MQSLDNSFKTILDALPDAIIWAFPLFDDAKSIIDFEIRYANPSATIFVNNPAGDLNGLRIRRDGIPTVQDAMQNFKNYLDVYQTGEMQEYRYYSEKSGRLFELQRKAVQGGVLSITRDRQKQREAEKKQETLGKTLQSIVDHSPVGILVYDAIRSENGNITNFRNRHYNAKANELTGYSWQEREQLLFSEILQGVGGSNMFDKYVDVVTTGEPLERELYISSINKWIYSTTAKIDDGFLSIISDITDIKATHTTLQHQSKYLESILNASVNAVVTMEAIRSEDGEIRDLCYKQSNKRFLQWFQLPEEKVVNHSMLELFPNTKETGVFDIYKSVIETGNARQVEIHYKDENIDAWYDLSVTRLDDNTAVGTFNDITSSRLFLEQISQQKNLLDNILRHSSNGISVNKMVRNAKGEVIDAKTILANDAAIAFVGLPRDIYLGKSAVELEPNILNSPYYKMCVNTLETGEPARSQYLTESTGRWLEVSVSRMDEETLITIFTDITSTKEAQLAIERSAEQLQLIINRTQSGIFTAAPERDENGRITDFRFILVNRALASYVNQEPEALAGELGSKFFTAYKTNGLLELFCDTVENGNANRFDYHYSDDGIDAWIDMLCTRLENNILVTFTDYTPIKLLQLELQKLVEELKRSNASLEEFAYVASHDLQEPLRKIQTFCELLKKDIEQQLTPGQVRLFNRIENATLRMRSLISDLLTYSQVSSKPVSVVDVPLHEVLQQVMQDLEATILEARAVIKAGSLPTIKGDERQLRQMFQNLVGNAIKYRKPDSVPEVEITSAIIKNGHELYNLLPEGTKGEYHLIEITDNGIGFEQEHAEKIFQVFQRLHGRSEYEGTGVGLAIVQRVVSNHKGLIIAEGEPGKGASFRILFPVTT